MLSFKTNIKGVDVKYKQFLADLAYLESRGNYRLYGNGYIGKYQFSTYVFQELKYNFNYNKFATDKNYFNEQEQDIQCLKLFKIYKTYLSKYLSVYKNKTINGIKMNEAAILSATHLVGIGSMAKFFDSGLTIIPKDGNNVSILYYMKLFQKYEDLTF